MSNIISWEEDAAAIEDRGTRGEPVITTVRVDGVKVKTVKISSEALEDERFPKCKDMVERKVRAALGRGLSPRETAIEIRLDDFRVMSQHPDASF